MEGLYYQGNETKMHGQDEEKKETCCIFKYMDFVYNGLGFCLILSFIDSTCKLCIVSKHVHYSYRTESKYLKV